MYVNLKLILDHGAPVFTWQRRRQRVRVRLVQTQRVEVVVVTVHGIWKNDGELELLVALAFWAVVLSEDVERLSGFWDFVKDFAEMEEGFGVNAGGDNFAVDLSVKRRVSEEVL